MFFLVLLLLLFANKRKKFATKNTNEKKKTPKDIGQFEQRRGIISTDSHAVYKQNGRDGRNSAALTTRLVVFIIAKL